MHSPGAARDDADSRASRNSSFGPDTHPQGTICPHRTAHRAAKHATPPDFAPMRAQARRDTPSLRPL
jgi:hypothetical protein